MCNSKAKILTNFKCLFDSLFDLLLCLRLRLRCTTNQYLSIVAQPPNIYVWKMYFLFTSIRKCLFPITCHAKAFIIMSSNDECVEIHSRELWLFSINLQSVITHIQFTFLASHHFIFIHSLSKQENGAETPPHKMPKYTRMQMRMRHKTLLFNRINRYDV